jgi:uncharacterized protein
VADEATLRGPEALGPRELAAAFTFATDYLGVHVDEVNALNVYPVPDGDTGTNMHLTLQSVRRQLEDEQPDTMADFCHALSYGSLLGARGNSGVILSQVLKGFADVAKGHAALGATALALALAGATKSAYAAVMKPVEGTILTVVRESTEALAVAGAPDARPLEVLRLVVAAGHESLARTPDLLPVLKQAQVVDAGGLGYLRMIEGIVASLEGRPLPPPPAVTRRAQEGFEEEAFGFCTEFLLSNVLVETREIQDAVAPFGDSLLVVGAEGFVKGHIHTEEPEKLLALVARYGTMVRSKVEDMSEQHSEILAGIEMGEAAPPRTGLVVVSHGYGPTKIFRRLGARVVGGGQTDNPSVQDIADAVRSLGAPAVVVLPNNKNVIMAAERVAELVPEKDVRVLPTTSLGQGLSAAVVFDEERDADGLYRSMTSAAASARTFEVTTASRDATVEGMSVRAGDSIGLVDGTLVARAEDPGDCLVEMLANHVGDAELGTLFYSAAIGPDAAEALLERLQDAHPDLELDVNPGAPDLYAYVLALE